LSYIYIYYSYIIKTICQHQQQLSLFIIYFIITPFLCQTWHPSPPWPPPPLDNPGPRSAEGGMEVILKMHVTGTPHGWTNEFQEKSRWHMQLPCIGLYKPDSMKNLPFEECFLKDHFDHGVNLRGFHVSFWKYGSIVQVDVWFSSDHYIYIYILEYCRQPMLWLNACLSHPLCYSMWTICSFITTWSLEILKQMTNGSQSKWLMPRAKPPFDPIGYGFAGAGPGGPFFLGPNGDFERIESSIFVEQKSYQGDCEKTLRYPYTVYIYIPSHLWKPSHHKLKPSKM